MAPVAPDRHSLLVANTSAATLFLDSWHDGSCPISSFDIVYKPVTSIRSKGESMRVYPVQQKQVVLKDLLPSTTYEIKMTADNGAGVTEAVYNFTTGSLIRTIHGNDMASIHGSYASSPLHFFDPKLILPTTIAIVMVTLLILVVRIWLLKKRQAATNFYGTVYGQCSSRKI